MSIVVQSSSSVHDGTSGTILAIPAPTGISIGDLLVILFFATDSANAASLAGWTVNSSNNLNGNGTAVRMSLLWKIADSGDVAASTFSPAWASNVNGRTAIMLRITGANTSAPITTLAVDPTINGNSPTFNNTITPKANSLILFAVGGSLYQAGISGYAITTSNPTWTEIYDSLDSVASSNAISIALASAIRSQSTATGNSSVTATVNGTGHMGGLIFSIAPAVILTLSDTQATLDKFLDTLLDIYKDIATTLDSLIIRKIKNWSNDQKNTSTWTDDIKH